MKRYNDYDMSKVNSKYVLARVERKNIVKNAIVGFICGLIFAAVLFGFLAFLDEVISTEEIQVICAMAISTGIMFSGFPYAYSQTESLHGILWILRITVAASFGMWITIAGLIQNTFTIIKYKKVVQEHQTKNPELYFNDVLETVNFLVGNNTEISRSYVTEQVIKYRDWLSNGQISGDEYVQLLREIVK